MTGSTRAGFLRAAGLSVAGLSTVGLASCAQPPAPPPIAGEPTASRGELAGARPVLSALLDTEYRSIAAYAAGIPLLTGRARSAARLFLGQELGHANELQSLIRRGGGRPAKFQAGAYDLGDPRSADDVLRLLHRIEQESVGAYLSALPRLHRGTLRPTLASVLAAEAQHIAVLRTVSGLPALAAPLVTASE